MNSVVEAVFHHAAHSPDKLCLADEVRNVTYSQYCDEILRLATVLQNRGISKGDRVVVEASQTIDFLGLEFALHLLGAVFVPVERNCAWSKIQRIARLSSSKLVVTQKENDSLPDMQTATLAQISLAGKNASRISSPCFPLKDEVSEILFSTGTTGTEKGIVITHDNNLALAENVICGVSMLEDNVEMIPSPLNHSHGLRRYYGNMVKGATVVLATGVMNVKMFFDMVDRYQVNSFDLVPTALSVLLKLSKGKFGEYRDVVRYMQFGSAPLSDNDMKAIRALLPKTRLLNFYGSTESGCICIFDFNAGCDKPKCIGRPTCNATIVIVDENRTPIHSSKDNTGFLASRGRMNMRGYWQDQAETDRVMADGYIYSNDEAYFDEEGDIILLGRKGDVINTGGNKVSPDEIEDAAKLHPSVADCGCIGVPDPIKGWVPKLYIQLKKGYSFDPVSINSKLMELLEPYKIPAYIEEIEQIPRTFNGKLLRRVLREKNG